jgi:plasmid stabilization system protein ParE
MKILWLKSAVDDLVRLKKFIADDNPIAAKKAATEIKRSVKTLIEFPMLGKPVEGLMDYRDLMLNFGTSGYVLRYRLYENVIYIVHIKHCRESGFESREDNIK